MFAGSPGNAAIIRAGTQVKGNVADADVQLLGWQSPTYGDIQPAISLVYETRSELPVRFVTAIFTDDRCKLESRDEHLVVLLGESEIYRVNVHRVSLSRV
jgi:hypothetical protein